eukprot:7877921-Pyramimonas_sp.AAC.1
MLLTCLPSLPLLGRPTPGGAADGAEARDPVRQLVKPAAAAARQRAPRLHCGARPEGDWCTHAGVLHCLHGRRPRAQVPPAVLQVHRRQPARRAHQGEPVTSTRSPCTPR